MAKLVEPALVETVFILILGLCAYLLADQFQTSIHLEKCEHWKHEIVKVGQLANDPDVSPFYGLQLDAKLNNLKIALLDEGCV